MTNEGDVHIGRDGSTLEIVLRRKNSTISRTMIATIVDAVEEAGRGDCRVIVLTADTRNFCTGMDLVESNSVEQRKPRVGNHQRRISDQGHRLIKALLDVQLPVVVGVGGWAAGIGLGIALCADHVVADPTAKFWAPYVRRGFTPDSATTYLLPRAVGTLRAKAMLMRGIPADADEALAWGLVSEIAPSGDLAGAVRRIAQEFDSAATVSVGLTRNLVHRNFDVDISAALHNEEFGEEVSLRSVDFREGITALTERRDPRFEGL